MIIPFLLIGRSVGSGVRNLYPVCAYPSRHFFQRLELLLVEQCVLCDEIVEVFVAGVDVRLGPDGHEPVEMVDVNVDKDTVETRQDLLADGGEVFGKWDVRRHGKDRLVVNLRFNPEEEGKISSVSNREF